MVSCIDWQKVFELHKLFNLHNHEMINYKTLQTVRYPLGQQIENDEDLCKNRIMAPHKMMICKNEDDDIINDNF